MSKKTQPIYRQSQPSLYACAYIVCDNLADNLAPMSAFRGIYTDAFVNAFRAEIEAAQNMPDNGQRTAWHERLREELKPLSRKCLNDWQLLKRYIINAYPAPQQGTMLQAAGWSYYEKAGENNWEYVLALMTSGINFITDHEAELKANNNMPDGFKAMMQADKAEFQAKYLEFMQELEHASEATQAKTEANNAIYAKAIMICEDGFQVFNGDEAKQELFSYNRIREYVTPTGSSSVIVTVKDSVSNKPIALATVMIRGEEYTTNSEGRAEKHQLSAGPAAISIQADGYNGYSTEVTLNTGRAKYIHVALTPLFSGELTPGPEPTAVVTEEALTGNPDEGVNG